MAERNTRTRTLKKYISDSKLRLSEHDRSFLKDLSKVGIIDEFDAKNAHYQSFKSPASKRLNKLCDAGVLERVTVNQPGKGNFNAYHFKTDKVASLFGGKKPKIGRKRNALHEVITSKLYFAEGRPDTFLTEAHFGKKEREMFELVSPSGTGRNHAIPDALYVKPDGQIVVIEADSGQYNKTQIKSKQDAWTGFEQVWGQPAKAAARVGDAKVYRF